MNTKITKFLHISWAELANYLLKWKMFQMKAVEENENILCPEHFLHKT
jgi:hypothetical protein